MKFRSLLLLLVLAGLQAFSQIDSTKYYVQFTDKNNSPYSISDPGEYLSQRAIDRRQRQGISIVENDLPVNPQYLQGVKNKGVTILNPTKWLNGVTIQTDDPSLLELVNDLPYVEGISKLPFSEKETIKSFFKEESIVEITSLGSHTKSAASTIYNYGLAEHQIDQINGIPLHEAGYDGSGIVIAVLDGGFSGVPEHPVFDSLWANGQILGSKDFVTPGASVYTGSGHGKSVLSTMGANLPGEMVGTAPKADYWLLRSEHTPTENIIEEYNWVSAAEFADSVGADVINSSLSYRGFDMPEWDYTYEDLDGNTAISSIGADIASSKGILVVNSAGNSGSSTEFPYNGSPACADSVFSIGAVNDEGIRASFSSIGPTVDGRIKPAVMAMGAGTTVAYGTESIGSGNGTSYSSPIIAGMSACLIQANPDMKVMQLQEAIKQSASLSDDPDNYYGWGIPDYEMANSIMTTVETKPGEAGNMISVSPNPFSGNKLNIYFSDEVNKNVIVELLGAPGNLIHKREFFNLQGSEIVEFTGNFKSLPAGVYFLKVTSGEKIEVKSLVKQ